VAPPAAVDSGATSSPTPTSTVSAGAAPPSPTAEAASGDSSRARVHVVQKGDTLYSLALRYYGTRAGWEKIYQANRSGLPSRDQLKVGQQLVIP
jgi:nucleoid-associated protein YgaU